MEHIKKFRLSQSSIKDWKDLSPAKWYRKWVLREGADKRSAGLLTGSVLDVLMLTPDKYDERFIIFEGTMPSANICNIVNEVFRHTTALNTNAQELNEKSEVHIPLKEYSLEDNKDLILKLCVSEEYFAKTPETGYNKIIKNGQSYFEFLQKSGKKTIITQAIKDMAEKLKFILLNDPVSKGFFVPKRGCEVFFQVTLFADFDLVGFDNLEFLPIIGKVDIIHVNNKRKEVREVDLKFTNDAYLFYIAVKQFDYPQQHSIYDYLIREWIKTFDGGRFKKYTVMNPLNVVIDDDVQIPYIYSYDSEDLVIKRTGIEGTWITGWENTIREIAYHFNKSDWTRPRDHQMNGYRTIKLFNRR